MHERCQHAFSFHPSVNQQLLLNAWDLCSLLCFSSSCIQHLVLLGLPYNLLASFDNVQKQRIHRVILGKYIFLAFLKWQGRYFSPSLETWHASCLQDYSHPPTCQLTSISQWSLPVKVHSFLSKLSLVLLLGMDGLSYVPPCPDMFFLWHHVTLSFLNLGLRCVH